MLIVYVVMKLPQTGVIFSTFNKFLIIWRFQLSLLQILISYILHTQSYGKATNLTTFAFIAVKGRLCFYWLICICSIEIKEWETKTKFANWEKCFFLTSLLLAFLWSSIIAFRGKMEVMHIYVHWILLAFGVGIIV